MLSGWWFDTTNLLFYFNSHVGVEGEMKGCNFLQVALLLRGWSRKSSSVGRVVLRYTRYHLTSDTKQGFVSCYTDGMKIFLSTQFYLAFKM